MLENTCIFEVKYFENELEAIEKLREWKLIKKHHRRWIRFYYKEGTVEALCTIIGHTRIIGEEFIIIQLMNLEKRFVAVKNMQEDQIIYNKKFIKKI
ncbi:hypothetical protein ACSVDA_16830 [Cytobacillus sp. Hm23]